MRGTYGLAGRELLDEALAVPTLRGRLAQEQQLLPRADKAARDRRLAGGGRGRRRMCARPASACGRWQGWGMGCGTCKSRYPAICSRKASSTSADQVRARRMPTGDALDSRCSARATGLRRAEASAAAALLGPGMPPPCRPGEAPAPLCRPGDAALRGSCESGSIEPAGSEAARPPMLLSAIPLMPCRSSKGDEVSERIVAAPSGPLEGLNLPLSLRSGSDPAFASIVRFSAGPRRRDGGLTRSPSWRRGFVGWGGGAPEPLLLLLVLSSS